MSQATIHLPYEIGDGKDRESQVLLVDDGGSWSLFNCGAAITIAYTCLFGFESFGMHIAMTATVAATLALVIVMIIALDWPFRGQISVSPDPFILTQQSWADAPIYKK
jgi:hypothetical protein